MIIVITDDHVVKMKVPLGTLHKLFKAFCLFFFCTLPTIPCTCMLCSECDVRVCFLGQVLFIVGQNNRVYMCRLLFTGDDSVGGGAWQCPCQPSPQSHHPLQRESSTDHGGCGFWPSHPFPWQPEGDQHHAGLPQQHPTTNSGLIGQLNMNTINISITRINCVIN